MGKAASRPRRRGRAPKPGCCTPGVNVAGITAPRAAEGSGSEWGEDDVGGEEANQVVVVSESDGARAAAALAATARAESASRTFEASRRADADAAARRVAERAASSPRATSAVSSPKEETRLPAAPVKVFLSCDEPGMERRVRARLFLADDPLGRPSAPPTTRSIEHTLKQHAGTWPAYDERHSCKGKTNLATQRLDWEVKFPWEVREPSHEWRRDPEPPKPKPTTEPSGDGGAAGPPAPPAARGRQLSPPRRPSRRRLPTEWTPSIAEGEQRLRWRYQGGGMHQPIASASVSSGSAAGEENIARMRAASAAGLSPSALGPEVASPSPTLRAPLPGASSASPPPPPATPEAPRPGDPRIPAERWLATHRATDADAAEVIAVDALEARAEVALAVDGERALSPKAAAAAAEVSRATAAAEKETGEAENEGAIPAESPSRRADSIEARLSAARAADRERRRSNAGKKRDGDRDGAVTGEHVSAPRRVESPSPDQLTRIAGVSSTPSRRRFRRRRVGRDGDESAATALSFADQGIGGADEKVVAAMPPASAAADAPSPRRPEKVASPRFEGPFSADQRRAAADIVARGRRAAGRLSTSNWRKASAAKKGDA